MGSINTTVKDFKPAVWGALPNPIKTWTSPMTTANSTPALPASVTSAPKPTYTPPITQGGASGLVPRPTSQTPPLQTSSPSQQQFNDIYSKAAVIQQGINNLKTQQQSTPTQGIKGVVGYPGAINSITDASNPSKTQTGLVTKLQKVGEGNVDIGKRAGEISDMYGKQIADVGRLGAGAVAGAKSTGTSVVGAGNAAIASQSASSRIQSLSQAQQAALQGTGQQLTGQQQYAAALGTGLGGANVQQQQQISGLGTAAGLMQPVQVAPGSTLTSPTSGETVAGGLGGYVPYRTAEQVMGLISQYPDAGYQYNPQLTPEQNLQAAQAAIQKSPTYQKGTFGVPGQNTVQGATSVQAAQQGYTSTVQSYNQLYTSFQNADSLADNVMNILEGSGVNPFDVKVANQTIQDVKRQLSSVEQQKFDTAMQEMRNAFAGIVASYGGQTPTNIGEAYNVLLDPSSSMGAINAAIEQLKYAGQTRLQAEYGQVQNYYNQLGGQGGSFGGSSGGTNFDW